MISEEASALQKLQSLEASIEQLEQSLAPLTTPALRDRLQERPALDQAKLLVSLLFTMNSSLLASIRLGGYNLEPDHPLLADLVLSNI